MTESAADSRRATLIGVNVLLFTAGAIFGLAALWLFFGIHFTLDGSVPDPTPGELARIDWCAAGSVVCGTASLVVALIVRGRWAALFGTLSGIGTIAAILLALALGWTQLPGERSPDNAPDLPPDHQPCYSGSNTCN